MYLLWCYMHVILGSPGGGGEGKQEEKGAEEQGGRGGGGGGRGRKGRGRGRKRRGRGRKVRKGEGMGKGRGGRRREKGTSDDASMCMLVHTFCSPLLSHSAPSLPPPSFRASNISSRQFMLSWSALEPININGILRNYVLSVSELNSSLPLIEEVEIKPAHNVTEYMMDSLTPYTLYTCSVAASTVETGPAAVIEVLTGEEGGLQL
jgi:hypothetical protein